MNTNLQEQISAMIKNKKIITSSFNYILDEIPTEQRNELEALITNLSKENENLFKDMDNKHGVVALTPLSSSIKKIKEKDEADLILFENGVFLGIVLGFSKRSEVKDIMNDYSECLIINENIKNYSSLFFYRDLDVAFCFDNSETVKEITFGKRFKGKTSKGLKINDDINQAINIYGIPKISETGFINSFDWEKLHVFSENQHITHIRFN
jgi:hypothetical protein